MKLLLLLFMLLGTLSFSGSPMAATFPSGEGKVSAATTINLPPVYRQSSFSVTLVHILLNHRRLSLKEKLVLKILKWKSKLKMGGSDEPTPRQRKLAKLSLIFGIAAVLLLVIPYAAIASLSFLALLSIPLSISGLVLGIKSVNGNSNATGLIGLVLSGSVVLIFLLAFLLLAILFAGGGWY